MDGEPAPEPGPGPTPDPQPEPTPDPEPGDGFDPDRIPKPKPISWKFDDVKDPKQAFYHQIYWMAQTGLSTGTVTKNAAGKVVSRMYQPKDSVSREAMAPFLYRYSGSPKFQAPKKSPFVDLKPSDKFYKEIMWLSERGITTGVKTGNRVEYRFSEQVTREAMAAFLNRHSKLK